jgi:hypothetical protein
VDRIGDLVVVIATGIPLTCLFVTSPTVRHLSWRPLPGAVYFQQTFCGPSVRGWLAVAASAR